MEIAILISILVLCMLGICLVCVTELMKKMCDRMNWLQDQFNSFKDYNDKEYAEIMKQVNDLRSRLKSLEDKIKKNEEDKVKGDEDCLYDEVFGIRARLDALEYKVNESKNYLCENLYEIDSRFDVLDSTIDECKKTLNEIRTEKLNKEGKEETD